MGRADRDEDHGLTPREWLDSDPVPLTPDIDLDDPEQRQAWIRANNEEIYQRSLELQRRRERSSGVRGDDEAPGRGGTGRGEHPRSEPPRGTTTVVGVRVLHAEHRALVRLARRHDVTVSDLVRRWVRAGLDEGNAVDPDPVEPDERELVRAAVREAADAAVVRITDELRRLREIAVGTG